jgi:RNA polymerase sigma factor (TIGR02999 family)
MIDVTQILNQVEAGDPRAQQALFEAVYLELRQIAAAQLAREKPGQTLQPTALVHEAWLRLVKSPPGASSPPPPLPPGERRRYFFAAAAEAMRRILVEQARAKLRLKRGGADQRRLEWTEALPDPATHPEELLALHDELEALAQLDTVSAELVKLRLFGGYSMAEAAEVLQISSATAYRNWEFARAWLTKRLTR